MKHTGALRAIFLRFVSWPSGRDPARAASLPATTVTSFWSPKSLLSEKWLWKNGTMRISSLSALISICYLVCQWVGCYVKKRASVIERAERDRNRGNTRVVKIKLGFLGLFFVLDTDPAASGIHVANAVFATANSNTRGKHLLRNLSNFTHINWRIPCDFVPEPNKTIYRTVNWT